MTKREESIKDLAKQGIHVSAEPHYFCGTLIGWQADIVSFNQKVESKINVSGTYDDKDDALRAGIDCAYKQLRL